MAPTDAHTGVQPQASYPSVFGIAAGGVRPSRTVFGHRPKADLRNRAVMKRKWSAATRSSRSPTMRLRVARLRQPAAATFPEKSGLAHHARGFPSEPFKF
eukprot:12196204-Alexandrium_andersonii.AAC.1